MYNSDLEEPDDRGEFVSIYVCMYIYVITYMYVQF